MKVGKPLPGVVGGDVEIIETCKGFQQPSSPGEYADFWLPSIPSNRNSECQQRNDTKKPPQNIRNFTMNHLSQGVFFSHCRQQTNCFFSLVAKIATVSLGFLTPMWSSWIRCFAQSLFKMGNPFVLEKLGSNAKKTKPSFSLSCNFSLSVERCQNRNEINEIKSLFGMGRVCSIYIYILGWSLFFGSIVPILELPGKNNPRFSSKKTMSRFFPQFLDYVNSSCICARCSKTQGVSTVFDTTHLVGGHPLGPAQAIDWQDFLLHKASMKEFGSAKLVMSIFLFFFQTNFSTRDEDIKIKVCQPTWVCWPFFPKFLCCANHENHSEAMADCPPELLLPTLTPEIGPLVVIFLPEPPDLALHIC